MVTPVGGKMSTENTENTEDIGCPALHENGFAQLLQVLVL